jgi:hypothetical protein
MRHFVSAACSLFLAAASPVVAEEVVVIELYTSQGCSSCPPADEFLSVLAANPRVLPLALHVDYWDYIGWADKFAQAKFTDRQRAYARAIGSRTIYTPQLIIGGLDRIEGFAPEETADRLNAHLDLSPKIDLSLSRTGDSLVIRATSLQPFDAPVAVQLVRYTPEETITIERGENAGKTITYRNIVTSWENLGTWVGPETMELTVPFAGSEPGVVILQSDGPSAILAAARVD